MYISCVNLFDEDVSYELDAEGISIGSNADNVIVVNAVGVSSFHARLYSLTEGEVLLEDLGSLNGVFLNSCKIDKTAVVHLGDRISIGMIQIQVRKCINVEGVEYELAFEVPKTPLFAVDDVNGTMVMENPLPFPANEEISGSAAAEGNNEASVQTAEKGNAPIPAPEAGPEPDPDPYATAMTIVADARVESLLMSGDPDAVRKAGELAAQIAEGSTENSLAVSRLPGEGKKLGKYEIVKQIGKGGMGVIYLARHETLKVYRALKVLTVDNSDENDSSAERFLREARLACKIHHPNVVSVMDVEKDEFYNVSYIVMEYIDGGSLRNILKKQKTLSEAQSVVIVQAVAMALSAALEHKIVHRDIKPDNIMFTKRSEVKLADLGIAKIDNDDVNLTKTNIMIGTPAYLSPEQVENPKAVDVRSDIYSLGATFYEMLTGEHPYEGTSTYDVLHKLFSEPVPDPRSKNGNISAACAKIVMKMLDKEPKKRYQTPAELLAALRNDLPPYGMDVIQPLVQEGECTEGGNESPSFIYTNPPGSVSGYYQRKKKIFLWSCIGGLVLLLGLAAGTYFARDYLSSKFLPFLRMEQKYVSLPPPPVQEIQTFFKLSVDAVPETEIRLVSDQGNVLEYIVGTGKLEITGIPAGRYRLRALCKGKKEYNTEIAVTNNTSLKIDMEDETKKVMFQTQAGAILTLKAKGRKERVYKVPVDGWITIPELPVGTYEAFVHADGFEDAKFTFVLDHDFERYVPLISSFAELQIRTAPEAAITLTGNKGNTYSSRADKNGNCFLKRVRKDNYKVRILLENHKDFKADLEIARDENVQYDLEPLLWTLRVLVAPETKLTLYRNGVMFKVVQVTGDVWQFPGLPQGGYELTASRSGYLPVERVFVLKSNMVVEAKAVQAVVPPTPPPASAASPAVRPKPAPVKVAYGHLVVRINARGALLNYLKRKGLMLNVEGWKDWVCLQHFPGRLKLAAGKVRILFSAPGIQALSDEIVEIRGGKNTELIITPYPKLTKFVFDSNCKGAQFVFEEENIFFKVGGESSRESFRKYTLRAMAEGFEDVKHSVYAENPGALQMVYIKFEKKKKVEIPPELEKRFQFGMELFRKKEYKKALPVLRIAGEKGHPEAAWMVSRIYREGLGMWFSDSDEAWKWRRQASKLGHVQASFLVGEAIYEEDLEGSLQEMIKCLENAVEGKKAKAAYMLYTLYEKGRGLIAPDRKKSLSYLFKAVELKHPAAMYELGVRYENGDGVPRSLDKAFYWWEKADTAGEERAKRLMRNRKK